MASELPLFLPCRNVPQNSALIILTGCNYCGAWSERNCVDAIAQRIGRAVLERNRLSRDEIPGANAKIGGGRTHLMNDRGANCGDQVFARIVNSQGTDIPRS